MLSLPNHPRLLRLGCFGVVLTLFVVQFTACTTYTSREDFDKAIKRAAEGEEVARDILEQIAKIPPELRSDAIDAVAAHDSSESRAVLREMLAIDELDDLELQKRIIDHIVNVDDQSAYPDVLRALQKRPSILNAESAAYLMGEKSREAAALIYEGTIAKRIPVSERILLYFGETDYGQAVGIIERSIPDFPSIALQSLGAVKDAEADRFILDMASAKSDPYRDYAIRNLFAVADVERAMAILIPLLRENDAIAESTLISAIVCSGRFAKNAIFETLLKNLYMSDPHPSVREASIEALSAMMKRSERELHEELIFPTVEYRTRISYLREGGIDDLSLFLRESDRAKPSPPPPPLQRVKAKKVKKRVNPQLLSSEAYYSYLIASFERIFGEDVAQRMLINLNNALIAYSDSDSEKAKLIVRSYMRGYGGSEAEARKRIERGLRQPGCLGVILKSFSKEYAKTSMAVFAFAQIFSIQRWQSDVLFDLARNGEI